jgi:hypothetical protein
MPARQAVPCIKCFNTIEISESAFMIDLMVRLVGVPKFLEMPSRLTQASVGSCVNCMDMMARGVEPPVKSQPLNHAVYQIVREVTSNDPTFAFLSWLQMRREMNMGVPRIDDPKIARLFMEMKKALALPAMVENSAVDEQRLIVRAG